MLAALNRLRVSPGDVVFVPAGLPHSIGHGVFLVELQEPSDLSVLLEWARFGMDGRRDGHLGLGFGLALEGIERRPLGADELARLHSSYGGFLGVRHSCCRPTPSRTSARRRCVPIPSFTSSPPSRSSSFSAGREPSKRSETAGSSCTGVTRSSCPTQPAKPD
jgi:hypothetical protein